MNRLVRVNWVHLSADIVLMMASLCLSLLIRVDGAGFIERAPTLLYYLPLFIGLRLITMVTTGVYDIIWRYVSVADSVKIVRACFLSTFFIISASYLIEIGRLPRSIYFIDLILVTMLMLGARVLRRIIYERNSARSSRGQKRRTLVVGAGNNGRSLASRFQNDSILGVETIGFIDDDLKKVGRIINGIKVLGTRERLSDLIRDYQIQEVVIAMSQPTGELLREVFQVCRPYHIKPRLISNISSQFRSGTKVDLLREIELKDLLARPAREFNSEAVQSMIEGKVVLITGAGGSIGSELSRQVLSYNPSRLLLLDHSEYNLYNIDQELRVGNLENSIVEPVLVDVKDKAQVDSIMKVHRPDVVFHAAAYKHVHLVEANPFSAILNNIMGTKNVMDAALEIGVRNFTLISTDKAVNPAGVMGATKRICELLVARARTAKGQVFCAVRFGNVLGSSGSLIPLLKKQIVNGEPVTVTHPDMARYFMLIPEAVSLVLNASVLAKSGDILILKMGEPVKIVDIAKSLIAMMGKNENEVPIVFTGARPGEKLVEELYLCGNEVKTDHPDILVAPQGDSDESESDIEFDRNVSHLLELAKTSNIEARQQLSLLLKGHEVKAVSSELPSNVSTLTGIRKTFFN